MDRDRRDRYGSSASHQSRHSRGPSRFSDDPFTYNNATRSPSNSRSAGAGANHRPLDTPPRRSPGRGGSFRPLAAPGGFGFNSHSVPPLSGQKRGFSFPGRGGLPVLLQRQWGTWEFIEYHFDGRSFAKLFVGSVPRTATEEDIRPLFEEHGNVIEVALITDKKTGQQQVGLTGYGHMDGCCFIKYATPEEAEQAIRALHNQYTLPGGVGPIQVRYADGERERLGAVEYKLFVGSLNKQATVSEVEEIFSKYGRVEDVYLMRDEMRQSRGCGFVKYSQRDTALAAIHALNGIYTMRGCDQPLTVRFADPKRPRQGDSRGSSFPRPAFDPRLEASVLCPPSNFNDPMGDHFPLPNAWRPMHMPNVGPSSNAGPRGMEPLLLPRSAGPAMPINTGGPMTGFGGPIDGPFQGQAFPSMSQQNFSQTIPQIPLVGQQISSLKKPMQSHQDLPPSLQLYPQAPMPHLQTPMFLSSIRQVGQPQLPSSGDPIPSQQLPESQNQAQQNALFVAMSPSSFDANLQSSMALNTANQQQLPVTVRQQPLQQSPSQLAQMLSQQTQTLQASFHSSQAAFSQLQQQVQTMQPPIQDLALQQNAEAAKKQSQWAGTVMLAERSTRVAAPVADVPSSSSAASVIPAINQSIALGKCNWTEHTSPEGFKYYYNSVTCESRWEKPEELILFERQKQQQMPLIQQSQTQPPPISSNQPAPQLQQLLPQGQLHILHQQQVQQPLSSSASGATGHQNVQEVGNAQLQTSSISVGDPARFPQGIHATQEWMVGFCMLHLRVTGNCQTPLPNLPQDALQKRVKRDRIHQIVMIFLFDRKLNSYGLGLWEVANRDDADRQRGEGIHKPFSLVFSSDDASLNPVSTCFNHNVLRWMDKIGNNQTGPKVPIGAQLFKPENFLTSHMI
ncbi:flowering time control protein FCA isoform X1 [Senna tora]|uniref:Flowering time control protein FCA isoform X1 n=1 Tax=Senna tora TaxID=362788 RepID=A0A834X3K4_9FABA|nr:flowering time control protein FCA isoform X1 [Senna tora]